MTPHNPLYLIKNKSVVMFRGGKTVGAHVGLGGIVRITGRGGGGSSTPESFF